MTELIGGVNLSQQQGFAQHYHPLGAGGDSPAWTLRERSRPSAHPATNIRYSDFSSYLPHTMIDTTDLKRELDELTNRLGKTQEYL